MMCSVLWNKVYKKDWLQFLFVVKATALKQQMSTIYPHILSTEASYHIYTTQWPAIKVKANFCAYNVEINF